MLINLTPHPINIIDGPTLPSSGVARVSASSETVGSVDGVPIVRQSFGDVEGLPDQVDGMHIIVSRMVAAACPDRADLLVPADMVRDDQGRIVGCRSLERI